MAKFSVLFFAALAFQAAFAGIWRYDGLADQSALGLQGIQTLDETGLGRSGSWNKGSAKVLGIQIQTLANGLSTALESITVDNQQDNLVLVEQSRELARSLETIVERLQTVGADLPRRVALNLGQVVVALQRGVGSAQQLKWRLIACIQEAATEIQKLAWLGLDGGLSEILGDFVVVLQNLQIQLQNVHQSGKYGLGAQQLAVQIQASTNNLALFLHNVPSNGELIQQKLEVQARRLAQNVELIIQRLEVETNGIGAAQQVALRLRQIVTRLEQVTWETSASAYGLSSQLNLILQTVASELRRLAVLAQNTGALNGVVRSVLIQYLNVIQNVQVQLQGINQTVQVGQTPRELGLQIEGAARRLVGTLRIIAPPERRTQIALVYQARRLSQILDIIVSKLQTEVGTGNAIVQQVANILKQIQVQLQQATVGTDAVSIYQVKSIIATLIQDAAIEIQKLAYVDQADQLIRGVLIDFLTGLQDLQVQIQDNLQIVHNGQNPRTLVIQIQAVAQRLSAYLQHVQPNSQQLRQTLVIQVGELTQTIENVIQLLQTQIKNTGENSVALKQTCAQLNKISLSLQKSLTFESVSAIDLSNQLNLNIQNVVEVIQRLAYIADSELQQIQVGTNRSGALNGVFNNVLATLRNIFIQLQNTHHIGTYGLKTDELANQIQTVTSHLTQSLQLVGANTKEVKQALAIQALRYALRIQHIVDRLDIEVSYNAGSIQQIVQNLRQVVVALQQIGGSWTTTSSTADIRTQLNTQVQNVAAQIQKLLVADAGLPGPADVTVKRVLIEYLAAVQSLNIRIQRVAQISQKGQNLYQLAIQIDTAVSDLATYFQRVLPSSRLVGKTIVIEARQVAEVIANIINRLQAGPGIGINGLVSQLKQIELSLQQIVGEQVVANTYQLELNIQRAAVAIQQLAWAVQPELQQVQISAGTATLVRDLLKEFLVSVQNVYIQVYNAVPIDQIRRVGWGLGLQGQKGRGLQGQGWGLGLQGQRWGLGPQEQTWGLAPQGQTWGLGLQEQIWSSQGQGWARQSLLGLGGVQSNSLRGLDDISSWNQLGDWGLQGGVQDLSWKQLINQIRIIANSVAQELQTVAINDQQIKQVIIIQARQLVQVIDNIIDRLQVQVASSDIHQVIGILRQIQVEFQQITSTGGLTTVHQIRAQFVSVIENIALQLDKLGWVSQSGVQVKNVLVQYLVFLRNLEDQLQGRARGLGLGGSQWTNDVSGRLENGAWGVGDNIWGSRWGAGDDLDEDLDVLPVGALGGDWVNRNVIRGL